MTDENKTTEKKSLEADFSPESKEEIRLLRNIEGLLKRVEGLKGDEAFAYVEARQYIATRAGMIVQAERARVAASDLLTTTESQATA